MNQKLSKGLVSAGFAILAVGVGGIKDSYAQAAPTAPASVTGKQVGTYFTQWSVYGRNFEVADLEITKTSVNGVPTSLADQLTFINYAFGNIYQKNGGYECGMISKLEEGSQGQGGDMWADYQRNPMVRGDGKPGRTVDGKSGPGWGSPMSGNFYQLKLLKDRHPKLKVFISLGGWTWSKHFSAASKTQALREQLAKSCVDLYIKGNLPRVDFNSGADGGFGGQGAAAGLFDGIDIDWEFPVAGGIDYNGVSPDDAANFTLLLQEFRKQLDSLGATNNKYYALTAAVGAGVDKIRHTQPNLYQGYVDWVNLLTYDFHGGWETSTNFNAPLVASWGDPSTGDVAKYNITAGVNALTSAGMPANKIVLGIPFYGRGWGGVTATTPANGLFQLATGAAPVNRFGEKSVDEYKILKAKMGVRFYNANAKQVILRTSAADGNQWWSYDNAASVQEKLTWAKNKGLRGAFSWSVDGDDNGELTNAIYKNRLDAPTATPAPGAQ